MTALDAGRGHEGGAAESPAGARREGGTAMNYDPPEFCITRNHDGSYTVALGDIHGLARDTVSEALGDLHGRIGRCVDRLLAIGGESTRRAA